MIATNTFIHNNIQYTFKWAQDRHQKARVPKKFSQNLERYYQLILSKKIPQELFNDPKILRCSNFRIKGLRRGAIKQISNELIAQGLITEIKSNNKYLEQIPESIKNLPSTAFKAFSIFTKEFQHNPGHDPILHRILIENEHALSLETPIWTIPNKTKIFQNQKNHPFNIPCLTPFTGHIDLILFDETDESLIIADYKPEREFLRSLPQVAVYGLVIKRILGIQKVKCVSFSREDAWIYDPEIIRNEIMEQIHSNGNPELDWMQLIDYI